MTKSSTRLAALGIAGAFALAVALPAFAMDSPSPNTNPPQGQTQSPPKGKSSSSKKKKKEDKKSEQQFINGYKAAHAMIYKRHQYAAAIDKLKSLGHDDNADVANLIGYSSRKLGRYDDSKTWYERALKTDPNHVLTWQYYGLWQIEQGNRDQAKYHLSRIATICGTDCAEYRSLAAALESPPGTGLVY